MSRLSPEAKLVAKREQLIVRTAEALSLSRGEAEALLRIGRSQSLRLNPLAGDKQMLLEQLTEVGWKGQNYEWFKDGYTIESGLELVRDSDMLAEGKVYIQNAASWLPVIALNPQPGEKILDLCAAPGGKTTHIAAASNNHAIITANDNSRIRLAKLQANCRRMQAQIERFTLFDARYITRKLPEEKFDKILIDAPCSGEGMMRLENDKDFITWSVAQIKRLQSLQKVLVTQAWQLLRPGGMLVYSTCTIAPEENEAIVDYLLKKQENAVVVAYDLELPNRVYSVESWNNRQLNVSNKHCLRLKPSPTIEAFFVAKIHKQLET